MAKGNGSQSQLSTTSPSKTRPYALAGVMFTIPLVPGTRFVQLDKSTVVDADVFVAAFKKGIPVVWDA